MLKSGYSADMKLDNIQVFGVQAGPNQVTVNGQTATFQYKADTKVFHQQSLLLLIFWVHHHKAAGMKTVKNIKWLQWQILR